MKIGTHFLATTLGVQAMGLAGQDRILAYTFGMAVDVDHLVKLPYYLRAVGLHDKRGYYWRSSLQEPVALLWILPLVSRGVGGWLHVPLGPIVMALGFVLALQRARVRTA